MRIGIDARVIYQTGVGRYIRNLIDNLSVLDQTNHYTVFLNPDSFGAFQIPNPNWEKVRTDSRWHSFKEQILMPVYFYRSRLDLVHIPYFNIPLLYTGKFVVTIHDLTVLHTATGRATMLPRPVYEFKKAGFYFLMLLGLRTAKKIIPVSQTTTDEI